MSVQVCGKKDHVSPGLPACHQLNILVVYSYVISGSSPFMCASYSGFVAVRTAHTLFTYRNPVMPPHPARKPASAGFLSSWWFCLRVTHLIAELIEHALVIKFAHRNFLKVRLILQPQGAGCLGIR